MTTQSPFIFLGLLALSAAVPLHATAQVGSAILEIMPKTDNVQRSNYGKNSFLLTNTGDKDIIAFELDVSRALFPDTVFDPEGLAGDSAAKPLQFDRNDNTGAVHDNSQPASHYIGAGGDRGYEQLLITFDPNNENGFNPGEVLGFSIDMDPNSIAGTRKRPLDDGSSPRWDVGGVSGAELIGSTFEVTFDDGSTASGELFATGTQAGSHGVATEQPSEVKIQIIANGNRPGEMGTYTKGGPQIRINGDPGLRVRVALAKGFIQPVSPYDPELEKQLHALSHEPFPANNAVEFQFADITLTGEAIDISSEFDFTTIQKYDLKSVRDQPFSIDEDKVPLGIVAAVIDPESPSLPRGVVTAPIYLTFRAR